MVHPTLGGIVAGLRITVLVEGRVRGDGLLPEHHGSALWIESGGMRILFDAGDGGTLVANANNLGIPLALTDAIVISHGHSGHSGGLNIALAKRAGIPVYHHPEITVRRFSTRNGRVRDVGMSEAARMALAAADSRPCRGPIPLAPGIWATGPILRREDDPARDRHLLLTVNNQQPDQVADDQALVIELDAGSVICTGCCHSGVSSTVMAVQAANGGRPIAGLIGGLHLLEEQDTKRFNQLAAWMVGAGIHRLATGACTGRPAEACFSGWFGDAGSALYVGDVLDFGTVGG